MAANQTTDANTLGADERAALIASMRRMGLIGELEEPAIEALSGGISSTIVKVTTGSGALCLKRALPQLRVAQPWFVPVERNAAEVAWLRRAEAIAPGAVPRLLAEDSEGHCYAMAYLDPAVYRNWKVELRDGVIDVATARAVGELLGSIHAATAGREDVAREFANDALFHALRLDPYFNAAATVNPAQASILQRLVETTAATKLALVHGDVSPKNLLVGPDGPVLLDAECAWYGYSAFDLAFCLTHLLLKGIWRPQHRDAYLACFETLASAYLARVDWEAREAMESRAALLLAGIVLARVDGKSPVEYITESQEKDFVRRLARRFLDAPAASPAAVAAAWRQELTR